MMSAHLRIAPLLFAVPLAACAAGSGSYPSLAIRDAERVGGSLETPTPEAPPAQPAPPSADLLARLGQLQSQAASAHQAFLAAVPATRRAVRAASGAGIASDRYASAQVALADLDSHRSRAAIALGDLDLLFADAALSFELRAPIVETRADVTAMIAQEDAVLAELRGAI
ncbi:hypothetical protein AM2010_1366 [Pelagerythrobacter marensis]|uniref:Lipoprotein n=2 Tax=Pelagerythrobacter marensis TaxID=543877 RepID=A0A0G3XAL1_9SPHN|nr:hypothetical protein AM2010_1366 [Pelagerythrobacter marensis]